MTGGFTGQSNMLVDAKSFKITKGEDKIKGYTAKAGGAVRHFCTECSSMLYTKAGPFMLVMASAIISPSPLPSPAQYIVTQRNKESCPDHVASIEGAQVFEGALTSPSTIEWHKANGHWVD